eukprot:PhM_4_TR6194/c0_g1_i1/m.43333
MRTSRKSNTSTTSNSWVGGGVGGGVTTYKMNSDGVVVRIAGPDTKHQPSSSQFGRPSSSSAAGASASAGTSRSHSGGASHRTITTSYANRYHEERPSATSTTAASSSLNASVAYHRNPSIVNTNEMVSRKQPQQAQNGQPSFERQNYSRATSRSPNASRRQNTVQQAIRARYVDAPRAVVRATVREPHRLGSTSAGSSLPSSSPSIASLHRPSLSPPPPEGPSGLPTSTLTSSSAPFSRSQSHLLHPNSQATLSERARVRAYLQTQLGGDSVVPTAPYGRSASATSRFSTSLSAENKVLPPRQSHATSLAAVKEPPPTVMTPAPEPAPPPPAPVLSPELREMQTTEGRCRTDIHVDENSLRSELQDVEKSERAEVSQRAAQRQLVSCTLQEKYARTFLQDEEAEIFESLGAQFKNVTNDLIAKDVLRMEMQRRAVLVKEEASLFRLILSARAQRVRSMNQNFVARDAEYDQISKAVQLALEFAWTEATTLSPSSSSSQLNNHQNNNHSSTSQQQQQQHKIPLRMSHREGFVAAWPSRCGVSTGLAAAMDTAMMLFDGILVYVQEFVAILSLPASASSPAHSPCSDVTGNPPIQLLVDKAAPLTRRQAFLQCEQYVCRRLKALIERSRGAPGHHMTVAASEVCQETCTSRLRATGMVGSSSANITMPSPAVGTETQSQTNVLSELVNLVAVEALVNLCLDEAKIQREDEEPAEVEEPADTDMYELPSPPRKGSVSEYPDMRSRIRSSSARSLTPLTPTKAMVMSPTIPGRHHAAAAVAPSSPPPAPNITAPSPSELSPAGVRVPFGGDDEEEGLRNHTSSSAGRGEMNGGEALSAFECANLENEEREAKSKMIADGEELAVAAQEV